MANDTKQGRDAQETPVLNVPLARLTGPLLLAILPLVLVLGGYYRSMLLGGLKNWPVSGDATFYAYQFARMGELHGQWWKLGEDKLVGFPYQPEFAKHPGIFEGVDLLMLSSLTSRWFDQGANYYFIVMAVMVANGWIVGWLVRRLTGSWIWGALGEILVIWNYSTAIRLQAHAHLFKFGWTVLAALAFSRYLDQPTVRRGVVLGLAMALVLQGSFYLGFLLGLACVIWWLGCLVAGSLVRRHLAVACAAVLSFALAVLALTFPVWTMARSILLTDAYYAHSRIDAWENSADLWQYFLPPDSTFAKGYIDQLNTRLKTPKAHLEGSHYPGHVILLAMGVYMVWRLRSPRPGDSESRLLDRFMGLSGLLVLLSLAGGPSFLLVSGIGCFRSYGRAGLLAVALWCVAAPVILHHSLRVLPFRLARPVVLVALLGLSLYEGHQAIRWSPLVPRDQTPAWVDWLGRQPPRERLAAFPLSKQWEFDSLPYRIRHRHACLNGAESLLLEADLKLLGCSLERMNQAGLRFIVSLGYQTLAFHQQYVEANPWIRSLPWLDRIEERGPWLFYRANTRLIRLPHRSLEEVLAAQPSSESPLDVPAGSWITARLSLDRDVVVGDSKRIYLAWFDARDHRVGNLSPALFQHLFGPDIPAFTAFTPKQSGSYRLVFLDERGRPIQSRSFKVRDDLDTISQRVGSDADSFSTNSVVLQTPAGAVSQPVLILENKSPLYLQVNSTHDRNYLKSARAHPAFVNRSLGSLVLKLRLVHLDPDRPSTDIELLLPSDLPPRGRLELSLPEVILHGEEDLTKFEIRPQLRGRRELLVTSSQAKIPLVLGHLPKRL